MIKNTNIKITLFAFFILLLFSNSPATKVFVDKKEILKEAAETDEFDGPELAAKQEFNKTKDPTLGFVPKERLYAAYQFAEKLRSREAAANNTQAAIGGLTWTERGPDNVGGRTRAIMVDPNDASKKTIWSAGVGGGLWKTTDITVASPTWTSVNDFFNNIAITSLAYNPASPTTMYFGTGEGFYNVDAIKGDGIWKSTNGGATWTQLAATAGNSNFEYIQKVAVHPTNGYVFAATRSRYSNRGGLYRSTDGGTTWTKMYPVAAATYEGIWDLAIGSDGKIHIGYGMYGTCGYAYSTDNGVTWTGPSSGFANSANIQRISLAVAPGDPNKVFALCQGSGNAYYNGYYSTNGGSAWTVMASKPGDADTGIPVADFTRGQAWYDLAVSVDPNNTSTLIVGGIDLFKSTDNGTSWTQISKWSNNNNLAALAVSMVHSDQHAIVFEPGSSSVIYFGNDGGIFSTTTGTNAAPTISAKVSSYNVTQFYSCAMHPASGSNYFLAGAQDNGSHKFTTAGMNSTTTVSGGDGAFCHIDQDNPNYQFTSYVYCVFYRSTNGGTSWTNIANIQNRGDFINPSDYDNFNDNLYFNYESNTASPTGTYGRILSASSSTTISSITLAAINGNTTAITASPNNTAATQNLYIGTDAGTIVKVTNANAASPTGTAIGTPVANASVSCIEVETGNENHILVTYSNYGVNSVWETVNGGTAWTSIEGNLPDMPIRWVMINPAKNTQALVATELGVWTTDLLNGTSTVWGTSNSGLANVRVDMLQTRTSDKIVAAATHGRGLFTSVSMNLLPVELLSFTGKMNDNDAALQWSTASERNNSGFEIQRATDLENFQKIGFIGGSGSSTTVKNYSFTDYDLLPGKYYYRIKQVDFDGSSEYFPTIAIEYSKGNSFLLEAAYPNPAQDELNLQFPGLVEKLSYKIFDLNGKMVASKEEYNINRNMKVEISSLTAGVYFIQIQSGGKLALKKFVKL